MNATLDQVLQSPWARWVNRILGDSPEARARLAAHAGKVARLRVEGSPFDLALAVTGAGWVEVASRLATPALTVVIPPGLLARLASKDPAAEREIAFEGDAALGADLRHLSRHLSWDVEADLSRMLGDGVAGDLVAHRAMRALRDLAAWRADAAGRLGANVREYLTEERPALVPRRDVDRFGREVETLRDDVARLEARLKILQSPPSISQDH